MQCQLIATILSVPCSNLIKFSLEDLGELQSRRMDWHELHFNFLSYTCTCQNLPAPSTRCMHKFGSSQTGTHLCAIRRGRYLLYGLHMCTCTCTAKLPGKAVDTRFRYPHKKEQGLLGVVVHEFIQLSDQTNMFPGEYVAISYKGFCNQLSLIQLYGSLIIVIALLEVN